MNMKIDELDEFTKCAADPVYFADNYAKFPEPMFDYQRGLLTKFHTQEHTLGRMCRQSRKTSTLAGYLLWAAMFKENETIGVFSVSRPLLMYLMMAIIHLHQKLPNWMSR